MSYYPPYYPFAPYPQPGDFRNQQMTPEQYAQAFEPPFPSGHTITPATPNAPAGVTLTTPYFTSEDAAVDQFIARSAGRGTGGGYIDNILRLNRGRIARIRMTFNSGGASSETKVFTGHIETAARDHIVLSDPQTGGRFLLLMIYLDYIEFPEEINYYYPSTNQLNIVDEKLLDENPEVMPLYHYQKAKKEKFLKHLETVAAQASQS